VSFASREVLPLLTQHIVAEAAQAAGITAPARYVAVTGSTNSDLLNLASQGGPAWSVLVAGHQQGGRGRLGRSWISKPGQSLLLSVLLRPDIPAAEAPILSLAAAVVVVQACGTAAGVRVRSKWPNDLVLGDRKLGGILPEASVVGGRLEHVVLGIGLNVEQRESDFPPELGGRPTSLIMEGGSADPGVLLREVLAALRTELAPTEWLAQRVIPRYREVCESLGRQVRATLSGGRTVEGRAADIGPTGELIVETSSGTESVGFGEIEHLD
jgi:BirA family transcriptional regulator, biotin operon repressor / biotin---[acetyl-CoA-carboxylase] ligase